MRLLLLVGAVVLGLLVLAWVAAPRSVYEGFLTVDPPTQLAQRQQLQFEGERRYNNLARIQDPLTPTPPDAGTVAAAIGTTLPAASAARPSLLGLIGSSLGLGAADDGSGKAAGAPTVEQTGIIAQKIAYCESLPLDCTALDDPRAAECGMCHRDGLDSRGRAHRGGMFISSDDQIRANELSNSNGGPASYRPSVGSCDPKNFTVMRENCQARELQLQCQRAGAATSSNQCGQCYGAAPAGATGLLYVGPKPRAYTAVLYVSHPGAYAGPSGAGLVVTLANGGTVQLSPSPRTVLDPQSLSFSVTEGDTIKIQIYGCPAVWCGWLSSPDGNRTVSLDVGEQSIAPTNGLVIAGDKRSGQVAAAITASPDAATWSTFQGQVPNTVLWYGRRSEILLPIITQAWYGITPPSVATPIGVDVTSVARTVVGNASSLAVGPALLSAAAAADPAPGQSKMLWLRYDDGTSASYADGTNIALTGAATATTATLTIQVPATLVDPIFADDKADCPTGPLVFTEVGAGLMGAHSCFKADGSFNPTPYCLQELFGAAGGTPQGTDYPSTQAKATALVAPSGTLDDTVAALNNRANIALYGVDMNGAPVDFATFKDAAMRMFGTSPKNPCDGPNAQTGPHSPECLDYLWRTSGDAGADANAIVDPTTLPYQYCGAAGLSAPLNPDGTPNQANVAAANANGSLPGIRGFYQSIFQAARNSSDFDAQAAAMRACYNINLQPPVAPTGSCPPPNPTDWNCMGPSATAQPEVFAVCGTVNNYSFGPNDTEGVCATYGARVATPAEITAAQAAGADWCSCGWASDGNAYYPITVPRQYGCGAVGVNNCGTMGWAGGKACVSCYGVKPSAPAQGIPPFTTAGVWNQPQLVVPGTAVSHTNAGAPGAFLRHSNFQFWVMPNDGSGLFSQDGTLQVVSANNGKTGYVSFQSVNFPTMFLRHSNFRALLNAPASDGSPFNDDSSFRVVAALNGDATAVSYQSSNFPSYYLSVSATGATDVVLAQINLNDSTQVALASWKPQSPLAAGAGQLLSATAVPAVKEVAGQILCAADPANPSACLYASSMGACQTWAADPANTAAPTVAAPSGLASFADRYIRARV
jgi:hypothetical protein